MPLAAIQRRCAPRRRALTRQYLPARQQKRRVRYPRQHRSSGKTPCFAVTCIAALVLHRRCRASAAWSRARPPRASNWISIMTTPRPRIVLLQGAFDILNYGHIRAFKFAKAQGDYLIVALNTNELIRDYKGREPVMLWSQKRRIIEACRYVDRVVPAREFSPLKLLKRYQVDVYVLSREWENTKAAEISYMKQKGGRVCFSRRFHGVSTSAIKATLLKEHLDAQSAMVQLAALAGGGNERIRDDASFGAAVGNGATVIPLWGRQSRQAGARVLDSRGT